MCIRDSYKSVGEWKKIGVKTLNRRKLPYNDNLKAAVIIPEGSKGNAYLVFENFKVIMKWNRSEDVYKRQRLYSRDYL